MCFVTNVQNQTVTITVIQKTSISGTTEDTQTFTLTYNNSILKKNINLFTAYTLINIDYTSFNGILSGFIEKLNFGDSIIINANNNLVDVKGFIDISGQRLDISGQRLDISGQRVDISGQRSGQRLDISGQRIDISGQSIIIQGNDGTNIKTIKTDLSGNLYSNITDGTNSVPVTNTISITNSNIYGFNIYKTFSKVKSFAFNTYTTNINADVLILPGSLTPYNIGFGLARATTWYGNPSITLNLNYTYVDSSGNEGNYTMALTGGAWTALQLSGGVSGRIVSINEYKPINRNLSGSATISIAARSGSTANTICYNTRLYYFIGVFTCPNNAIAWISDININTVGTAGSNDHIRLWKYDTSGIRKTIKIWYNITNNSQNLYIPGSLTDSICGFLNPGESFAWSGEKTTTTTKFVYSTMNVMYF